MRSEKKNNAEGMWMLDLESESAKEIGLCHGVYILVRWKVNEAKSENQWDRV